MSVTRSHLKKKLASILERKNISGEYSIDFYAGSQWNLWELFPDFEKFHLEIGCGWGEYTRQWAIEHPQIFTLAIEKKKKRVLANIKEAKKSKLNNIRFAVLDVSWFFETLFLANQFQYITINFPDPWPKSRHHKHRFVNPIFLEQLSVVAEENALLEFVSDSFSYSHEVLNHIEASNKWKNKNGRGVVLPHIPNRPISFFESMLRKENENVYILQAICTKKNKKKGAKRPPK